MAFWESLKAAAHGNFSDAANYLFIDQEEVDRGRAADDKLTALTKEAAERGLYTPEQAQATLDRIAENSFSHGGIFENEGTNIVRGFGEGLAEGAVNVQQAVKGGIAATINTATKGIFGTIPWQLWLIIIAYGLWKFGLLGSVLKKWKR